MDSYWPFKRAFRTILLSYLPPSFRDCLRVIVHGTLHNFKDDGTRVKLAEDLDSMGILSDFKTHISGALEEEITQRVLTTCPRVRNRPMLPELRAWYNDNIKTWLTDMYGKGVHPHILLLALCLFNLYGYDRASRCYMAKIRAIHDEGLMRFTVGLSYAHTVSHEMFISDDDHSRHIYRTGYLSSLRSSLITKTKPIPFQSYKTSKRVPLSFN